LVVTFVLAALQACAVPPPDAAGQRASGIAPDQSAAHQPYGQLSLAVQFINVGGVRLRYVEHGTGEPPVVLLHGNGSMLEDFTTSGLIERIAARHRVIAFDRPGFGQTERPRDRSWTPQAQAVLFAEGFTRLGIERPVALGHSWGTLVALALALDHPETVSGLVLVSGYYYPVPRPVADLAALPAIPVLGDALRYTVWPLFSDLLGPGLTAAAFSPAPVPPRFIAGFPAARALRPEQIRAAAEDSGLLMPSAAALKHRYVGLRLPVAIVAGAEDRIVNVERQSARLHHDVPGSELWVVPGQGHMVHHGAAGVVADAVEVVAAGPSTSRPLLR
ncbi:MAG: alpha/beta hydrolase, partial [Rhodospirillales bacterium]|nr:alpha/beta hydrolase [Rhodospirillales bacterium]